MFKIFPFSSSDIDERLTFQSRISPSESAEKENEAADSALAREVTDNLLDISWSLS